MRYLFISDIKPLCPLLDFDIDKINIDLHNDFNCFKIKNKEGICEFHFIRITDNRLYNEQNAVIIFANIVESNLELILGNNEEVIIRNNEIDDIGILTNFAKGELTQSNKYYFETNIKYFFIDVFNGKLIDIFCKEAIIILW